MKRVVTVTSRYTYQLDGVTYRSKSFHAYSETFIVPLSFLPITFVMCKLNRAINRLLPIGRRHRGDLQVAV